MNKKLVRVSLLALGVIFTPLVNAASVEDNTGADGKYNGDVSGHTFLSIRPQFQSGMSEKESLWRRRAFDGAFGCGCEGGMGGAIQVVGFGGRSTRSARLGEFFMFGGSNQLTVNSDQSAFADINPFNFGIVGAPDAAFTFSSTIQFNPRQSVAGVGFEWRQYFGWWNGCGSNWWFDISFPVVQVSNRVTLTEIGIASTGTFLAGSATSITGALAGQATFAAAVGTTSMQFGLIPTASTHLKKTGVADVEIKIGYDSLCSEHCYVNGYVGALIPTGNRPKGVYIFEPMVGHNHHAGILFGGEVCYDFWTGCDRALTWEMSFDSRYLFKGRETRSFDLRNRPWSRYQLVFATPADAAAGIPTPGINVFTREMNVTPRFQLATNTALIYSTMCGFQAELGYNFWARQAEKISLRNPFPAGISIAGLTTSNDGATTGIEIGATNLLSTIGNNNTCNIVCAAGGDTPTCVPSGAAPLLVCTASLVTTGPGGTLSAQDISLESAANPATISNIVYGTLGYNFDLCCLPVFLGLGGSYEFSSVNTSINRWNIWGKFGVSY